MNDIVNDLIILAKNDKMYASLSYPKDRDAVIRFLVDDLNPELWDMNSMVGFVKERFGSMNSYVFLRRIAEIHGTSLSAEDRKIINGAVQELDVNVTNDLKYPAGVLYYKIMNGGADERSNRGTGSGSGSHGGRTPKGYQDGMKRPQTSYSGTDMVCTITIPGKPPMVFGELSQLSYSIFREKVPVRSLGRVSMKGYTRGMRTITGIMAFTVFDQSIVYQAMKEIKEQGYRMIMDEMPLFDITISMANEFGQQSLLTLYGVSTYTEGQSMGVNDMMIQNVYEFYALDIDPMARIEPQIRNSTLASSSPIGNGNLSSNDVYWGHPN